MQRFSEEEAQEILRRAVRAPEEVSQDDLRRSAEELGISPDALARAEAEVREERTYKAFDRALRSQVRNEVTGYLSVMAGLVAINLFTSPGHLWFVYPLIFWGICVAKTVLGTRDRHGDGYRRAFEKWQEKEGRVGPRELTESVRSS